MPRDRNSSGARGSERDSAETRQSQFGCLHALSEGPILLEPTNRVGVAEERIVFSCSDREGTEYAPAYAALAEAYTTIGLYGVLAPDDIMPRAKLAARRALEIASDSASAHATAACIAAVYEWDWREAAGATIVPSR